MDETATKLERGLANVHMFLEILHREYAKTRMADMLVIIDAMTSWERAIEIAIHHHRDIKSMPPELRPDAEKLIEAAVLLGEWFSEENKDRVVDYWAQDATGGNAWMTIHHVGLQVSATDAEGRIIVDDEAVGRIRQKLTDVFPKASIEITFGYSDVDFDIYRLTEGDADDEIRQIDGRFSALAEQVEMLCREAAWTTP